MTTLSELVVSKSVVEVIDEYRDSEDNVPLVERKTALNSYYDELENAELTELQECYVNDVREAVINRNVDEFKRLAEQGHAVFTVHECAALRMRSVLSMSYEDFKWQYATLNSLAKQEALAKGRLDVVASLLEQETKVSRAGELEVIEQELVDLHGSCESLLDEVEKFYPRLREVRDTVLTEPEKDFVLGMVEAIHKTDMVLLYNAMMLGEKTIDEDVQCCLYNIALFFLQVWQMRWADKAMERLRQWVAAGSDINKPPKRVNVTKKMLEG